MIGWRSTDRVTSRTPVGVKNLQRYENVVKNSISNKIEYKVLIKKYK